MSRRAAPASRQPRTGARILGLRIAGGESSSSSLRDLLPDRGHGASERHHVPCVPRAESAVRDASAPCDGPPQHHGCRSAGAIRRARLERAVGRRASCSCCTLRSAKTSAAGIHPSLVKRTGEVIAKTTNATTELASAMATFDSLVDLDPRIAIHPDRRITAIASSMPASPTSPVLYQRPMTRLWTSTRKTRPERRGHARQIESHADEWVLLDPSDCRPVSTNPLLRGTELLSPPPGRGFEVVTDLRRLSGLGPPSAVSATRDARGWRARAGMTRHSLEAQPEDDRDGGGERSADRS